MLAQYIAFRGETELLHFNCFVNLYSRLETFYFLENSGIVGIVRDRSNFKRLDITPPPPPYQHTVKNK